MNSLPIRFETPVTLVGSGALDRAMVDAARHHAPALVAADSGADRLAEMRLVPQAVIGDMDSIAEPERHQTGPARFVRLAEQETTDFEKCLYATDAPLYVAVGFTGRRIDHTLAVFHVLLRYPQKRIVLVGEHEVCALAPPGVAIRLRSAPGARFSVYPLLSVTATRSRGLVWPLEGLAMAPGQNIGTSNQVSQPIVEVTFDGPGALLMLEREALGSLIGAVGEP